MPRTKKSRKPGQIGTPKQSIQRNPGDSKKRKISKGRASGSRNSLLEQNSIEPKPFVASKDKRHGSKKKISQNKQLQKTLWPKFKSPHEELDFIENDKKLQNLLDKVDQGESVNSGEQHYIDALLSRHKLLCELLGIDTDEQPDNEAETKDLQHTPDKSDDLLDQLDQGFKF